MKDSERSYVPLAFFSAVIISHFGLIGLYGPGFDIVSAMEADSKPSSEKSAGDVDSARISYEISAEDGVMFFEVEKPDGKRETYGSDRHTVLVGKRSDKEFWIKFSATGANISEGFLIPIAHFHKLAEMFDVVHIRRAGGII